MKRVGRLLLSSFEPGRGLFKRDRNMGVMKGISFDRYALQPPWSPTRGHLYGNDSPISNAKAT